MNIPKTSQRITKQLKAHSKRLWPITPWTIFFATLALLLCTAVSALVIQHVHNTAKQSPATSSSTKSQSPNKVLVNPTTISTQNTPAPSTPSSQGSASAKSPTSSTPNVTVPTVNACDVGATNDASARYTLAQAYLAEENYITIHVNDDSAAVETNPSSSRRPAV